MSIAVLGAGAFGTALAISIARQGTIVSLWSRDAGQCHDMLDHRQNHKRLPGVNFPESLHVAGSLEDALAADTLLLALPMQKLGEFTHQNAHAFEGKYLVACCKGVDLETGFGPIATLEANCKHAVPSILTGPSFAVDIAAGLPTALTLACKNADSALLLQTRLSTENLRLYRTTDTTGAELGGALKNVIAIACGAAIGAGLGESARAAVMTRGYAEVLRLALALGAQAETLSGLSGFGDLTLTCTSQKSRNYSYGIALGCGEVFDPNTTVEGAATAKAVSILAKKHGVDMPITDVVTAVLNQKITVNEAMETLLSRPLKEE